MNAKKQILQTILRLMAENHLNIDDISSALKTEQAPESLGLYLCQNKDGRCFECYLPQIQKDDTIIAFQINDDNYDRFLCPIVGRSHEHMEKLYKEFYVKYSDSLDIRCATVNIVSDDNFAEKLKKVNLARLGAGLEELNNLQIVEYAYEDFLRTGLDDQSSATPYLSVDEHEVCWGNVEQIKSRLLILRWSERE